MFRQMLTGIRNPAMEKAINAALDCHARCVETIAHCLEMGGRHSAPPHIRLMQDCAQICAMSADFMLRGSLFHGRTCEVCAEICETCAAECETFTDDEMMLACAAACRACAAECRRMIAA